MWGERRRGVAICTGAVILGLWGIASTGGTTTRAAYSDQVTVRQEVGAGTWATAVTVDEVPGSPVGSETSDGDVQPGPTPSSFDPSPAEPPSDQPSAPLPADPDPGPADAPTEDPGSTDPCDEPGGPASDDGHHDVEAGCDNADADDADPPTSPTDAGAPTGSSTPAPVRPPSPTGP